MINPLNACATHEEPRMVPNVNHDDADLVEVASVGGEHPKRDVLPQDPVVAWHLVEAHGALVPQQPGVALAARRPHHSPISVESEHASPPNGSAMIDALAA